jgi:hypothetical protein
MYMSQAKIRRYEAIKNERIQKAREERQKQEEKEKERLLVRANEIYAEKKLGTSFTPGSAPEIHSAQVLAVLEACAERINELRREIEENSHGY